jgi:hypothetical protein
MTMRTTSMTVSFAKPFTLEGMDRPQPAGTYRVDTDEELLDSSSFVAYIATYSVPADQTMVPPITNNASS